MSGFSRVNCEGNTRSSSSRSATSWRSMSSTMEISSSFSLSRSLIRSSSGIANRPSRASTSAMDPSPSGSLLAALITLAA